MKKEKLVTGTREQWLAARLDLLKAEKELTRRSDEVAKQRQQLPWVKIDKNYRFETEQGSLNLAELFQGRSQLLVYHFMFGPEYQAGCPHCSSIADGFNGLVEHLAGHDVMLWAVSRAPLARLRRIGRGWVGGFRGRHRSEAISIMTSTFLSLKNSSVRELWITITARAG